MAGKNNRQASGGRRRRDRFHADSHADAAALTPVPEMEGVPREDVTPITDAQEAADACEQLRAAGTVAYDTEFIGEETYWPELCLIQLASETQVVLIDPITLTDCTPVWNLLADDNVDVIVHAGKQDLDIAAHASGLAPTRVRDTQVLAGFAGLPWPVGLNKAIAAVLGVSVPGGMTFTAWDRRPLSPQQCRYAADDVRYLLQLDARLQASSTANNLDAWATLAQAERCAVNMGPPNLHSQRRKIENGRSLRKGQRATLHALVEVRDTIARSVNRPARGLLPDQVVLALTRQRPANIQDMADIRGMPRPVAEKHGQVILDALAASADAEPPKDPLKPTEGCPYDRVAIDALWHRFAATCLDRGLAPELICTRSDMARWHLGGGGAWPVDGWRANVLDAILGEHLNGEPLSLRSWSVWKHEATP
jgi:ribonuclease D